MPGPIILVVDDDAEVRRLLAKALSGAGYRPVFARNPARAPRHAGRLRPAAVVLDAVLGGGLDGFQLCAVLKRSPATRDIPVLLTSGIVPAAKAEREALRHGADGFVPKAEIWPGLRRKLENLVSAPGRAEGPRPGAQAAQNGAVLIAHDEAEPPSAARLLLEGAGYRVASARGETQIAALSARLRPDCIVVDYRRDWSSAPEFCRVLQSRPETRAVPVVVLSPTLRAGERCLDCGADHCVARGTELGELARRVGLSVRRYRSAAGILVRGDLRLDRRERAVYFGDAAPARLADGRFEFLFALVQASPVCVSHGELSRLPTVGGTAAVDRLAERTKASLGKPLSGRIHRFKDLGWMYAEPSRVD